MPRTDRNQVIAADGSIISEEIVERPIRIIGNAEFDQAKQVLRSMVQTFYVNGQPTGTPTATQVRNWLLALTAATRYLAMEKDDET